MIGFGIDLFDRINILSVFEDVDGVEGEYLSVENFFNDINSDTKLSKYRIKLINGNDLDKFKKGLKIIGTKEPDGFYCNNNGNIFLIDKFENIMYSIFISNFEIITYEIVDDNKFNVIIDGILYLAPKGTKKVWRIRLNKEILEYNLWRELEKDEKKAWLEIAFNFQREIINKKNLTVHVEGKLIIDVDSFFCCLGESINGPGGYFGRDLWGLNDCFMGGFGVELPLTIIWKNHQFSKINLNTYFQEIIKIFEINNVKIILL